MLFLIIGFYFLLACFIAWLVLFPDNRGLLIAALFKLKSHIDKKLSTLENKATKTTSSVAYSTHLRWMGVVSVVKQHYLLFLVGLIITCIPPLIALLASSRNQLDGFDAPVRETNMQVAQLLEGEQLVPPEALPPAVFTTQEVQLARPMLDTASRNWKKLNVEFEQRILLVFKIMQEKYGYKMAIIEGYRSPERQDMLSRLGGHVTNAKAFQSYHQFGLAADCAFLRDGKLVISEKDPWAMRGYELYGEVAESVGLTWGGRWKMMDFGHTELRLPKVLRK